MSPYRLTPPKPPDPRVLRWKIQRWLVLFLWAVIGVHLMILLGLAHEARWPPDGSMFQPVGLWILAGPVLYSFTRWACFR
jgi:hypothetical protein